MSAQDYEHEHIQLKHTTKNCACCLQLQGDSALMQDI